MAEYIEREAVERNLADIYMGLGGYKTRDAFYKAINLVHRYPAADVVPVVRCRDCKHAWIHPCGYVLCHRDGRSAYEMTFDIDSFCNYGERKEGAG